MTQLGCGPCDNTCHAVMEGLPDGGNKVDWDSRGEHREVGLLYWCAIVPIWALHLLDFYC